MKLCRLPPFFVYGKTLLFPSTKDQVAVNDPMSRSYNRSIDRNRPVLDHREPKRRQLLDGETRDSMATYQLPPPDRLHFGSDTSAGFTEPMKYNTISQSSRSLAPPNNPIYTEQARQLRHEQLPSVRQLLTPSTVPSGPQSPFSRQPRPTPSQRPLDLPSEPRGPPTTDSVIRCSQFARRSAYSQPQSSPTQMPLLESPSRERYQISPFTQQFHPSYTHGQRPNTSPYVPSFENPQRISYPHQQQQPLPPSFSTRQQMTLSNIPHLQQEIQLDPGRSQQLLAINASGQYFQEQSSDHRMAVKSGTTWNQKSSAIVDSVKPIARVVGEQDVSGQGPSWIYEDGTTCKKVIDGEAVNAQWGVTKAGKPRKRLAIACTTCREKKIKCDPAEPKCVQCEKFGRKCRFATA